MKVRHWRGGGRGEGGEGGQAGGREGGWGIVGRRKFYLRGELIKCIDLNEGEALKRGREGGEGRGRGAAENFTWGWNWSNVLILMKVRHWGGGGREGMAGEGRMEGMEILPGGWNWSNVLIQMKVRHWGGGPPSNLGVWRPLPLCSTAYGGGGREGGRREGGYRLIISVSWLSTTETHAHVTSHFRWPG